MYIHMFIHGISSSTHTYMYKTGSHESALFECFVGSLFYIPPSQTTSDKNIYNTLGVLEVKCGTRNKNNILGLLKVKCGKYQNTKNTKNKKQQQSLGTLGGEKRKIQHVSKYFWVVAGISTFHFRKSQNIVLLNSCDFPHVLCRFSGSKSPEHLVFACILLLSVSDVPRDSESRLPTRTRCELLKFMFEEFFAVCIYIHT